MTTARSAGEAIKNLVTLELECFDWLHFSACAPPLQSGAGADRLFRRFAAPPPCTSALEAPLTRR